MLLSFSWNNSDAKPDSPSDMKILGLRLWSFHAAKVACAKVEACLDRIALHIRKLLAFSTNTKQYLYVKLSFDEFLMTMLENETLD